MDLFTFILVSETVTVSDCSLTSQVMSYKTPESVC